VKCPDQDGKYDNHDIFHQPVIAVEWFDRQSGPEDKKENREDQQIFAMRNDHQRHRAMKSVMAPFDSLLPAQIPRDLPELFQGCFKVFPITSGSEWLAKDSRDSSLSQKGRNNVIMRIVKPQDLT